MSNKKPSKAQMRDAAFKKENLRLQRKIFAQQAKIVSLENELLLRPPYSAPQPRDKRWSVAALNKWVEELPSKSDGGTTNAA